MGSERLNDPNEPTQRRDKRRLTVPEAAEHFGITTDAVRMRIQRGTLERERGTDGRVYVLITDDETKPNAVPNSDISDVISAKDETIRLLREQLDSEREARRRADTILAQLSQANAEQARTIRELEPGTPEESPQEPESGAEASGEGDVPQDVQSGAEEPVERRRRSWWRRIFGSG